VTPDNKVVINTPPTVTGVSFINDLIHKYHVLPSKTAGPDMPTFPSGKIFAIYKTGSWDYATFLKEIKDFAWDIAPVPIGPAGKRIGYGGSNQYSSWKGVKSPDAAWALLKWNSSPEMTLKYWSTQGIPSVVDSALSPDFPKVANLTPKMQKLSAEAGAYMVPHDPTIRSDEWKKACYAELDAVWEGKSSPADACKRAQDKVQAIMSRP
jgi:multiple sugar transport system substrate-binding protein